MSTPIEEPNIIITSAQLKRLVERCNEPSIEVPPGLVRDRDAFRVWLDEQCKIIDAKNKK